jgi:NAD(P)H-binding
MRLTIFGASGQTGRHLLEQALAAGHTVTAVARDPTRLPTRHQRLKVVTADALDPAAIQPAVAGADAVSSALGPHPRATGRRSCRPRRPASLRPCGRPEPAAWSWSAPPPSPATTMASPWAIGCWPARCCGRCCAACTPTWPSWRTRSSQRRRLDDPAPAVALRRTPDRGLPPGQGRQPARRLPHLKGRPGRGDPGRPERPRHGQGDHRYGY